MSELMKYLTMKPAPVLYGRMVYPLGADEPQETLFFCKYCEQRKPRTYFTWKNGKRSETCNACKQELRAKRKARAK